MNIIINNMKPYLNTYIKNNVYYIEFFTPKHNALGSSMLDKLALSINNVPEEHPVIVLKSGGDRTFCAGASFDELSQISTQEEASLFFNGFAKVILSIRSCPQIVVASIQGKAVGGGVGLIAASDYAMATQYASLKLSELQIGIGPFVIAPAIIKKTSLNVLTEMSLNPENFHTAQWAKEQGFYQNVFEDQVTLNEKIEIFAEKLAVLNPKALRAMKSVFWENTAHWPELLKERAHTSGSLVLDEAVQQKIKSILSKA